MLSELCSKLTWFFFSRNVFKYLPWPNTSLSRTSSGSFNLHVLIKKFHVLYVINVGPYLPKYYKINIIYKHFCFSLASSFSVKLYLQELFELAQRKLLRQLCFLAEHQDVESYPRLFVVDFMESKEGMMLAKKNSKEHKITQLSQSWKFKCYLLYNYWN